MSEYEKFKALFLYISFLLLDFNKNKDIYGLNVPFFRSKPMIRVSQIFCYFESRLLEHVMPHH